MSDLDVCCWAYEAQTGSLRSALADNESLVHKKDSHERTALHWACVSGQTEIVQLLISLGAEVEQFSDPCITHHFLYVYNMVL